MKSIYAIGLITPNEDYLKKAAAYQALKEANIAIPIELSDYFNGEEPNLNGMKTTVQYRDYKGYMEDGVEVDLSDLPANVTTIRFYNRY